MPAVLALLNQEFCNLDAVQRSTLTDLVAAAPQAQTVGIGQIRTDTANKDQILAGGFQRHGILLVIQVVYQLDTGSVLQNLTGFFHGNGTVEFQLRSHSISVSCHFDVPVTVEQVREVIAKAPGVKLVDDLANKQYPMPLETSDQDIVFVGRIRPDLTDENGICLWCCGDQVRKGAATNAIQIAELLLK